MSCGDDGTNRPLTFRFPASDYVPPVPAEIVGDNASPPQLELSANRATYDYLVNLRKQLTRMFDATRTVTQDIQAPVVLQVNRDADQAIASGVAEKVEFNSVRYDTHAYWSPTSFRFNPRVAGFYRISWSVCFLAEAGGNNLCTAQLVVSGRDDVRVQVRNSSTTKKVTAATSTNLYLDGDTDVYIEIWATAEAATSVSGDPTQTFLTADYIGDIHVGALSGENSASTNPAVRIDTDNDSVYGNEPIAGALERFAFWTPALTALATTTTGNSLCAVPNGNNVDIVVWLIGGSPYTTFTYSSNTYDYRGVQVATDSDSGGTLDGSAACNINGGSNSRIAHMRKGGAGDDANVGGWFNNGAIVTSTLSGPTQGGYYSNDSAPCVMGSYVYGVSGDGHLTSWLLTSGNPAAGHTASYALSGLTNGHSGSGLAAGDDGYLYVTAPDPSNTSFTALYKFNADLTLADLWHCVQADASRPAPAKLRFDDCFAVHQGYLICSNVDGGTQTYYLYRFNADGTFTLMDTLPDAPGTAREVISLNNGFFATRDGVLRLT